MTFMANLKCDLRMLFDQTRRWSYSRASQFPLATPLQLAAQKFAARKPDQFSLLRAKSSTLIESMSSVHFMANSMAKEQMRTHTLAHYLTFAHKRTLAHKLTSTHKDSNKHTHIHSKIYVDYYYIGIIERAATATAATVTAIAIKR